MSVVDANETEEEFDDQDFVDQGIDCFELLHCKVVFFLNKLCWLNIRGIVCLWAANEK